jgi:uncharacterized protein YqgC (DUF456 family)
METPLFDDSGALDAPATAAFVAELVERGMRSVLVAGTTGEAMALSTQERTELIRAVRESVPAQVPVIAGTGAVIHGLMAYVFGEERQAMALARRLEFGMVAVNRGVVSDPAAPFGGVKQSGLGREGSSEGILEFSRRSTSPSPLSRIRNEEPPLALIGRLLGQPVDVVVRGSMIKIKVLSAEEAAKLIPDRACVGVTGLIMAGCPEIVLEAVEANSLAQAHPRDLSDSCEKNTPVLDRLRS